MKNLLKKTCAVILSAMIIAIPMTACTPKTDEGTSSTASGTQSGTTAPAEKANISIFQFKVEIADALKKATDQYMTENPNVKISIETVGGGDDYGASLRAKMQSGQEPTIFNIGGPQDTTDWADKLEDLSDQPWVAQAVDGTLPGVTKDGKIYGLPYTIEGYGIIYNKGIFEAAGLKPETVKSLDEMDAMFAQLKTKIDDGSLKEKYPQLEAGFELPAKETWITGLHTLNVALSNEFAGPLEAYESPTVEFKHADALKSLIDFQAKYTKHAGDTGKLNAIDYSTQVGGGLAIERVAAIQQGNWIFGEVANVDQAVADNLGMMPIPLKGVIEDSIPIGVPMYWCINKSSPDADKAAAKNFLNWLYQSEEGKKMIIDEFYFIPPFKNYEGLDPKDPLGKAVKMYADSGKTMPWVFMGFPTDWGMGSFGTELQKYFAGQQDFATVIGNAKTAWETSRKTV